MMFSPCIFFIFINVLFQDLKNLQEVFLRALQSKHPFLFENVHLYLSQNWRNEKIVTS